MPTSGGLHAALAPALADPALRAARIGLVVGDPATGAVLYRVGDTATYLPASTVKLATATAALVALEPGRRLTTTVVLDGDRAILVGGGDPTLASPAALTAGSPYPDAARLSDLADQAAAAIRTAGLSRVRVAFDASLFAGPAIAPSWKPTYVTHGDVAPVSALEVDGGRVDPRQPWRSATPALAAGQQFAALLRDRGIGVAGGVSAARAPADAQVVAAVQSPPVRDLVAAMLLVSDNDLAEALGRHVAIARGLPATFDGAAAAVRGVAVGLGVDGGALRMADASGLSRANIVAPHALTQLLALAVAPQHPLLWTISASLPVAGYTGTLALRYDEAPASAAVGEVWAKTGTLADANGLAGYVMDADGRMLSFAVLAGDTRPGSRQHTEDALDRVAATLVRCGCA